MHRFVMEDRRPVKLLAVLIAGSAALGWAPAPRRAQALSRGTNLTSVHRLAQAGDSGNETSIPSDQVDKYIAVYTAMQHDHSLTVEQAATHQGLTLPAFRALENKIERNARVHDRVLKALSAAAKAGHGSGHPPAKPR